ncbi:uncharacterized protein [Eulemur rufifrons]|uniref:uncharacterized protein n=1 Tax=Eulemur rufifrons TaxID=859984 RepID=UPI0037448B68
MWICTCEDAGCGSSGGDRGVGTIHGFRHPSQNGDHVHESFIDFKAFPISKHINITKGKTCLSKPDEPSNPGALTFLHPSPPDPHLSSIRDNVQLTLQARPLSRYRHLPGRCFKTLAATAKRGLLLFESQVTANFPGFPRTFFCQLVRPSCRRTKESHDKHHRCHKGHLEKVTPVSYSETRSESSWEPLLSVDLLSPLPSPGSHQQTVPTSPGRAAAAGRRSVQAAKSTPRMRCGGTRCRKVPRACLRWPGAAGVQGGPSSLRGQPSASHSARRCWAASAAAWATGESNALDWNVPALVPANPRSRTQARASSSQRRTNGPVALRPRLSLALALTGAEGMV